MLDDAFKDALNAFFIFFHVLNSPTVFARTVVNGIIQKMVRTVQITKHFKYFVNNFTHSGSWPIYLHIEVCTLLITTKGLTSCSKAFFSTNLVWVIGP